MPKAIDMGHPSLRIPTRAANGGFSLILSLAVMAMLLILCLGAAALLAIQLRVARANVSGEIAAMNANAALRLALGQLQEAAGPDRRVTARMDILARTGDAPQSGDYWTGVWRTDRLKADTTPSDTTTALIRRDKATGSLTDRRATENYVAENENTGPLVSYPNPSNPPLRTANLTLGNGAIRLLGAVSAAGENVATTDVLVPKITLEDTTGNPSGACAWWTADEGVKARTDLRDPYPENTGSAVSGGRTAPALFGLGTIAGLESLARGKLAGNAPNRARMTPGMLTMIGGIDAATVKAHFHDLAGETLSVLADTAHGGLRRDLTAFLGSGGTIPAYKGIPGLSDMDPMADYAPQEASLQETSFYKKSSPRFGILRDWANLSGGGTAGAATRLMTQGASGINGASAYHDGTNMSQIDMTKLTRHELEPVLTEAAFFMRLAYDPAYSPSKPGTTAMRLQIYPRFQLWNPCNVTLKGRDYLVHIRMLSPLTSGQSYFTVIGGDGKTTNVTFNLPRWKGLSTTNGSLVFILRTGDIPPGECTVYTPAAQRAHYAYDNPANNLLVPTPGGPANYFYIGAGDQIGGQPALSGYASVNPVGGTYAIGATQEDDVSFQFKEVPDGAAETDITALAAAPMVMYASCSPQFGSSTTKGPVFLPVPLAAWDEDVAPEPSEHHGYRFRWISETASNRQRYSPGSNVDVSSLGDFNVRSSIDYRYPYDNNTPLTAPLFWTIDYIRDYPDPRIGWITPPASGGRAIGNPFAGIGEWSRVKKFTLFDLPVSSSKVGSIASFRHARVSEFPWHPTYAVGESLMSPNSPSDMTCHPVSESASAWSGMGTGSQYAVQAVQNLTGEQLVYDQSFELNTALYDRFFASTGDAGAKAKFLGDPVRNPLPDARLVPNPLSSSTDKTAALGSMQRSAAELMVAGGFNVNSTSVDAWRALLSSVRDVPVDTVATKNVTAFPRVAKPALGAATSSSNENTPEANAGYRVLSDEEIGRLAQRMVEEVRSRGPFISMADFVNRRLVKGFMRPPAFTGEIPTSFCGALQAAILRASVNAGTERADTAIAAGSGFSGTKNLPDQKAAFKTAALPGNLTQGDILQVLDPVLAARSDTFKIRAYGESAGGATVRLEALVQRFPDPIRAGADGLNPELKQGRDFGRRFRIVSVRRLNSDEI